MNKKQNLKLNEPEPEIKSVEPLLGPIKEGGGVNVVIKGKHFDKKYKPYVRFGSKGATIKSITPKQLIVKSPYTAGIIPITVSTLGGENTWKKNFTYINPVISSLSPSNGGIAGGTTVQIIGTGFDVKYEKYGKLIVKFGSVKATIVAGRSSTLITVTSPPGTGTQAVTVTLGGTLSNSYNYYYY